MLRLYKPFKKSQIQKKLILPLNNILFFFIQSPDQVTGTQVYK